MIISWKMVIFMVIIGNYYIIFMLYNHVFFIMIIPWLNSYDFRRILAKK